MKYRRSLIGRGYLLFFLVVMLFVTIKKWKRNEE